jgi:hypothetical protein
MSEEAPLTLSVPEAGEKYFGLCRNAAYDAAPQGRHSHRQDRQAAPRSDSGA